MSLEGRLGDLSLSDIFQILNLSRRTGTLSIKKKEGEGLIVFEQGQVIYASSYNKRKLGRYLVDRNIVSNDVLEKALMIQKSGSPKKLLGYNLLGMQAVTEEQLEEAIKTQIKEVVAELLTWAAGTFSFELEDYSKIDVKIDDPEMVFLKSGLSTQFLLLESARLRDEGKKDKIDKQIDESDDIPEEDEYELKAATSQAVEKASRKDLSLLTAMIEELSGSSGAGDVTLMVLRFASEIMNRAVVFLVNKDNIRGLGQFGLNFLNGSADEKVRGIVIPLKESSVIKEVIEGKFPFKGKIIHSKWNNYLISELGGEFPEEAFISPMVCGDRVIAVLYGDNLPNKNKIENTEGLEAFMRVAGVALEKAVLEKKLKEIRPS
ncbi:MAG: DUF4388 domain-containing protein [Nitrospirae bacterium]|nr:DUF4388 domain-containing protein [Nitrospirota bacterium]